MFLHLISLYYNDNQLLKKLLIERTCLVHYRYEIKKRLEVLEDIRNS